MKNYGLIEAIQAVEEYIAGQSSVPYIPYNEDGDWGRWLPAYEAQADRFETFACTVFGTENVIETMHKFLYASEPNYSERFTALLSGLDGTKGTDPQIPCESIR